MVVVVVVSLPPVAPVLHPLNRIPVVVKATAENMIKNITVELLFMAAPLYDLGFLTIEPIKYVIRKMDRNGSQVPSGLKNMR